MTDLKKFKTIADAALSDLTVTDELKARTLEGLHSKRFFWHKMTLIPAACVVVLAVVICTILYSNGRAVPGKTSNNTGINTLAADGRNETSTGDNTFSPNTQVLESWNIDSMDGVKKYMGGAVLTPSYIPSGYKLKQIVAAGPVKEDAISIFMEYEIQNRSFTITQDKAVTKKVNPGNSREIDINGVKALVDSSKFDSAEGTIYNTELRWYKGDFMYAIQGSITEEEAIKVAKSLK